MFEITALWKQCDWSHCSVGHEGATVAFRMIDVGQGRTQGVSWQKSLSPFGAAMFSGSSMRWTKVYQISFPSPNFISSDRHDTLFAVYSPISYTLYTHYICIYIFSLYM